MKSLIVYWRELNKKKKDQMCKTDWKVQQITPSEIVRHLEEFHKVSFWNRNSLNDEELLSEHFSEEIKDKALLTHEGIKYLKVIDRKVRKALKICEKEGIKIARVIDVINPENPNGKSEWRICSPNEEQIIELQTHRWEPIISGFVKKIQAQNRMVEKSVPIREIMKNVELLIKYK